MKTSPRKTLVFALLTVLGLFVLLEAFASLVILIQMRVAGTEKFTFSEPTYFSIINVPYRAAAKFGLLDKSLLLDSPYEFSRKYDYKGLVFPEPRESNELPAKRYEITYSRRHIGKQEWEHTRVILTKNLDDSRWTGGCSATSTARMYIFGDSWIAGDGVNDEHTFSFLLQQKRKDLCVKLFAVGGSGLPTALLQFRKIKDEIRPNDYVVIGYADYLDARSVVAPSRLREVRDWYKRMTGQEQKDRPLLPRAFINNHGSLEITSVEENCSYNAGYCDQSDPSQAEMSKVSTAIINKISDETAARIYLLHFDGNRSNPIIQNLRKSITIISALPEDFDYTMMDDIMGFDPHPGPWWHYAISRKLMDALR